MRLNIENNPNIDSLIVNLYREVMLSEFRCKGKIHVYLDFEGKSSINSFLKSYGEFGGFIVDFPIALKIDKNMNNNVFFSLPRSKLRSYFKNGFEYRFVEYSKILDLNRDIATSKMKPSEKIYNVLRNLNFAKDSPGGQYDLHRNNVDAEFDEKLNSELNWCLIQIYQNSCAKKITAFIQAKTNENDFTGLSIKCYLVSRINEENLNLIVGKMSTKFKKKWIDCLCNSIKHKRENFQIHEKILKKLGFSNPHMLNSSHTQRLP